MKDVEMDFHNLIEIQNKALRDPAEVICGNYLRNGIVPSSLRYKLHGNFLVLLKKLNITLLITREYENMVIALGAQKRGLRQSFLHLPHPSGIAVNKKTNKLYLAATRNPNQIIELSSAKTRNSKEKKSPPGILLPTRVKYYAGEYYFHDLAFIGDELYVNSVGKNGIVRVDFDSARSDKIVWSPLPKKFQRANHIQLNSIAAGRTLKESYFSASSEKPGKYKPGSLKYPVNRKGVIFNGGKKVVVKNLTRPHSAKIHRNKLWVNNSGYGEFGLVQNGHFMSMMKFPGWTRGLCFIDDLAFVGVSKVIQKYKVYAPGITVPVQKCAVYAIDLAKNNIVGSIEWPYGNQIFGIDWIDAKVTSGFLFTRPGPSTKKEKKSFFSYVI